MVKIDSPIGSVVSNQEKPMKRFVVDDPTAVDPEEMAILQKQLEHRQLQNSIYSKAEPRDTVPSIQQTVNPGLTDFSDSTIEQENKIIDQIKEIDKYISRMPG